jgi:hypothetical protein
MLLFVTDALSSKTTVVDVVVVVVVVVTGLFLDRRAFSSHSVSSFRKRKDDSLSDEKGSESLRE